MSENKSSSLSEWDELEKTEVSTAELDARIKHMRELRLDYEVKKAIATEAHDAYEKAEKDVMALLKAAKKSSYIVEGLGTVQIRNRYVVRVPKDNASKQRLFDYIRQRHGGEELLALTSINHQTLNAFVNAEKEANPLQDIPGLEAPTHEESLAFRSAAK
jgi:hypothetical protein